jgi:hypothetical protein
MTNSTGDLWGEDALREAFENPDVKAVVGVTPARDWPIGPNVVTNDEERYLEYISHPKCEEAPVCPWHVWWQNGYMDDSFPPDYRKYCHSCAFWHQMAHKDALYKNGVIVAGESWGDLEHYTYDAMLPIKDPTTGIRGYGGRTFWVSFNDARGVVETNDLWRQGDVPKHLQHLFLVNAHFIDKPKTVKLNTSLLGQ